MHLCLQRSHQKNTKTRPVITNQKPLLTSTKNVNDGNHQIHINVLEKVKFISTQSCNILCLDEQLYHYSDVMEDTCPALPAVGGGLCAIV